MDGKCLVDQVVSCDGKNLLAFLGLHDEHLYFNVDDGHFYDRNQHKCAYSTFFELLNDDSSTKRIKCQAKLVGGIHYHQVLSREYVEISVIGWASKLRILHHYTDESDAQVVEKVLSAWPRKLSLLPDVSAVMAIFGEMFRKYRNLAQSKNPQALRFLSHSGNDELGVIFRKVIMLPQRYWSQPILAKQKADNNGLVFKEIANVVKLAETICWDNLQEEKYSNYYKSLLQFKELIIKYKIILKKLNLKNAKACQRNNNLLNIAKSHPQFKPSYLKRWLRYKESQFKTVQDITKLATTFKLSVLSKDELNCQLPKTKPMQFTVVLRISIFNEQTKETLERLANYVDFFSRQLDSDKVNTFTDEVHEACRIPWYMFEDKRQHVMAEIRKFANQFEKNQSVENGENRQFSIVLSDINTDIISQYLVYQGGECMKKIRQLPDPPTGLRVYRISDVKIKGERRRSTFIRLEWESIKFTYPGYYLVEFREKHSSEWKQKKTMKLSQNYWTFAYVPGTILQFRVALEMDFFGLSDFSSIVDTEAFV